MQTKEDHGYTIVELLITITIIVVLSAGLLMALNPLTQIAKTHDTHRKADLAKLNTAFENYYSDHASYPPDTVLNSCNGSSLQPYLDSIPCDPTTHKPYKLLLLPKGSAKPQQFAIYSTLENSADQAANIPNCANTIVSHTPGMSYIDIVQGCCESCTICKKYYGCRNGACVLVADDSFPSCGPSFCDDPTCSPINKNGQVTDCTTKNSSGDYVRECTEF